MPEGDTIYRTAVVLRRLLQGKRLTGFETAVPQVAAAIARQPVVGRVISEVAARGKHLLIAFRDPDTGPTADLVLHTHMRMTGSWHVYHDRTAWKKPARFAKVVLRVEGVVAPCFSAPIVELLTTREVVRHPALSRLGPDAIAEAFEADDVRARLRSRPDLAIGEGLLLQTAIAGVGNVFKSEILFVERVNPFARIGDLSDEVLDHVIAQARRLLLLNRRPGFRQTRAALDPEARIWVYRRSGRPCYRCSTPIRVRRQGEDARSTYFCPRCQGVARFEPRATNCETRSSDRVNTPPMDCAIFAVKTQDTEALRLILTKPSDRLSWNEGHQRHQVSANGEAVNPTSERPGDRTVITARGVAAAIAIFRATCTP